MALDPLVVALVLMAAILHASWNALTKSSSDPLLAIWLMTSTAGLMGGIGVFFVDAPEPASWPYLGTAVLLRLGYMLFLVHAYGLGDLSRVYPIARGLAPVLVAVLAAVVAEERPSVLQALGLLLCCGSIASLAFADAGTAGLNGRAVRSAVHPVDSAAASGTTIGTRKTSISPNSSATGSESARGVQFRPSRGFPLTASIPSWTSAWQTEQRVVSLNIAVLPPSRRKRMWWACRFFLRRHCGLLQQ